MPDLTNRDPYIDPLPVLSPAQLLALPSLKAPDDAGPDGRWWALRAFGGGDIPLAEQGAIEERPLGEDLREVICHADMIRLRARVMEMVGLKRSATLARFKLDIKILSEDRHDYTGFILFDDQPIGLACTSRWCKQYVLDRAGWARAERTLRRLYKLAFVLEPNEIGMDDPVEAFTDFEACALDGQILRVNRMADFFDLTDITTLVTQQARKELPDRVDFADPETGEHAAWMLNRILLDAFTHRKQETRTIVANVISDDDIGKLWIALVFLAEDGAVCLGCHKEGSIERLTVTDLPRSLEADDFRDVVRNVEDLRARQRRAVAVIV